MKASYAHRSFGEELWEKNRREGLSEYTERKVSGFVRREDRPNCLRIRVLLMRCVTCVSFFHLLPLLQNDVLVLKWFFFLFLF